MKKKNKSEEKIIEYEILGFLRTFGFDCWKVDRQGTYDPVRKVFRKNHNPYKIKGVSDIHAFMLNKFIAVEVKAPKGVLSKDQRAFLAMVSNNGHVGIVARSLSGFLEEISKHFPDHPDFQALIKQYLEVNEKAH